MISTRTLVAASVSVVFIVVAFWRVDPGSFLDALDETDYLLMAPAIGAYFAAFWLRAMRWRVLLLPLGPITTVRTYWVATIGYAMNNALPLRVGELARAFLMRRRPGFNAPATLATIVIERVMDGLTLLAWLGVSFAIFSSSWDLSATMRFVMQGGAALFGLASIAIVTAVITPNWALRRAESFLVLIPARFRGPAMELAESAVHGVSSLRSAGTILVVVILSQSIWAGETVVYWLVAEAMDIHPTLPVLVAAVATSNLATSVPSSSGGIGPFEFLAKESLLLGGIAASAAAAYAVLVHLTLLIPVTVVGAVFLMIEGVSLRDAVRGTEVTRR